MDEKIAVNIINHKIKILRQYKKSNVCSTRRCYNHRCRDNNKFKKKINKMILKKIIIIKNKSFAKYCWKLFIHLWYSIFSITVITNAETDLISTKLSLVCLRIKQRQRLASSVSTNQHEADVDLRPDPVIFYRARAHYDVIGDLLSFG